MFGSKIHRFLYIFFLAGIGFSLPCSVFLTSAFTIAISLNWFLQADTYRNLPRIISQQGIVFLLMFFLYLIFLLNTENIEAGMKAVRLKLPLIAIPLVVLSSPKPGNTEKQIILSSFILGVLFSSVSGSIYYYLFADVLADRRDIALFISHIRLSLMVCMAFFISAWYGFTKYKDGFIPWYFYIISALCLAAFLMILLSVTGIVIFIIALFYTALRLSFSSASKVSGRLVLVFTIISLLAISAYLGWQIKSYFTIKDDIEIDYSELSGSNNAYQHFPERKQIENGHYVWRFICEEELRSEWSRISTLNYDGTDNKGHQIKYTIIRYLSSMGIKKDSAGISMLEPEDIALIEAGYANRINRERTGLYGKIYELIWQIDNYYKGGNPQGHSITQRIEFFRTGIHVFIRYPFFGTGTGDFSDEFREQYRTDNTMLDIKYRLLSHNQFLTVLISFGLIGFMVFLIAMLLPIIRLKGWNNYLFTVFIIIAILSMLSEDTLETNTGVTFFSFFYSVLLFGTGRKRIDK